MTSKVLSAKQIEHFITRGWVKVPEAFPREQAMLVQDALWERLKERGVDRNDRSTWREPMQFIAENYNVSPFAECATQKLSDACSDIVGYGRWIAEGQVGWWGWWPVNFAVGAAQTWDVPADGWHYDSKDEDVHVDSPDQGLLVLCLFSPCGPRSGGTLIVEGSHHIVARYLRDNPGLSQNEGIRGCKQSNSYLRALCGREGNAPGIYQSIRKDIDLTNMIHPQNVASTERTGKFMDIATTDENGISLRVAEVTGEPGDVILAHPFMFHSPSFNHSGNPRFMCNRKTPLFEPLQLKRTNNDYSPLEESIRRAL